MTERATSTDGERDGDGRGPAPAAVRPSPWPLRIGTLLFREATEADIEVLQSFRNDPDVNRFMVRTCAMLRDEWVE